MVGSISNIEESQYSLLQPQASISMEIHPPSLPYFLLKPVKTKKIPNRHQDPPPPIIIEEEEDWEVSQILHSKLKRGKLWYLLE
ncbi:hypothetical protein O181_048677 [Austropuccinia psidii MF-1]|uniref:Uncharacterized protein n=1 Tax=Austropuccinia psidii MF-1 TaxID=1389203 RepID=A0A9Q3HLV4_9BASI|nr:hypothetical protein [Austropuccinia psidii MF-1]